MLQALLLPCLKLFVLSLVLVDIFFYSTMFVFAELIFHIFIFFSVFTRTQRTRVME